VAGAPVARDAVDVAGFDGLLARARDGDPGALRQLYATYAPAVAGYVRARGARDVDDLVSEVFLGVLRGIGGFEGSEAQFRSWLFVIVHRRLQDHRRWHARHPEAPLEAVDGHVAPRTERGADDEALVALGLARVQELCAALAPDQRDVLLLRVVADLTVPQVAAILEKSPGAVKQLQRRGLEALRRALRDEAVPF